jgi:hypothetical protein
MKVPERAEYDKYADVTGATRQLAEDYGLRVVVEGPHNSLPPKLLATMREEVMEVESMSRDAIESISEFHDLITFLRANGLADGVWSVLGGPRPHTPS